MLLVAYCVGEDVERPVIAELLRHLGDGLPAQAVVPVVLRDGCIYGLRTGGLALREARYCSSSPCSWA